MARLSFIEKVLGVVLLIQVCSVGLVLVLGLSKFEQSFERLIEDRLRFIVGEVRHGIERPLQLGLPLAAARSLQKMIEREAGQYDGILAIHVHDRHGAVVFSTDRTAQRRTLPAEWLQAGTGRAAWVLPGAEVVVAGAPVFDGIDQLAGGVVLVHSRDHAERVERDMWWNSLVLMAGFLLAFGLIALGALRLALSWLLLPFQAIERRLKGDQPDADGAAPAEYRAFAEAYVRADRELDDLARRLDACGKA